MKRDRNGYMEARALKYPVILAHGVWAKDSKLFWGRIPHRLGSAGVNVFPGKTDSWSGIENNALALGEAVDSVLELCSADRVNIIAHSKGGIDARYMISTLGYAPKIASLTTVSTPHTGSELVDFIYDIKYIHTSLAKKITYLLAKLYGDRSPDPVRIVEDLGTKNMAAFNAKNPDSPSVYYCSCASVMRDRFDDLTFLMTYPYLKKVAGANDGIVSLASAKWGRDFRMLGGTMPGGISHTEVIDVKRRRISGIDIPGEYLRIIDNLISKGC